jgi:cation transport regulator ChaC
MTAGDAREDVETLTYFAYGSNMSLRRLKARVPSASRIGIARLNGFRLAFEKIGRDGSAKCDITVCADSGVHGVLFALAASERPQLDACEDLGRGYCARWLQVEREDGHRVTAFTYVALRRDPSLRPYRWYHRHVLEGAIENRLPPAYLAQLRAVETIDDPDARRHDRELALYD